MSKQLAIFFGIGVVVVAIALVFILYGNKGSHLELKGEILKIRTGEIDEHNSAAVLDFRVTNISDVPFVVREVKVTAVEANGNSDEGNIISRSDYKQLLDFNRFLGEQYNPGLTIKDRIEPHQTVDRMVAARFEVPQGVLEKSKHIRLWIEDMDGPEFETAKSLK